jgi:hypothetical protein
MAQEAEAKVRIIIGVHKITANTSNINHQAGRPVVSIRAMAAKLLVCNRMTPGPANG